MQEKLAVISDVILDEASTAVCLRRALDDFAKLCADIGGVLPDRSFDGWSGDTFLDSGVAINPPAAAHCVRDYRRTVVFIRGIHAAIQAARARYPAEPLEILYAGCGPYASLILPLLVLFEPGALHVTLLDIHQRSIDSVDQLIGHFGFMDHRIDSLQADACSYRHPVQAHLVIAETMQKALEQEPQFAVTANLAPQLHPGGTFIPQQIEVELCLAHVNREKEMFEARGGIDASALEKAGERYRLATLFRLLPQTLPALSSGLAPLVIEIPEPDRADRMEAVLFTRIQVFDEYWLGDYEAEITLPLRCTELTQLVAGERWEVSYQPGTYPRFNFLLLQT